MVLALQIPLIIHNLLNPPTPSKSYYICPAGRCGRGFSPSKQQIPFFFLSTRRMTRVQCQHRLFRERMGLIMAGRDYSLKELATMYWEEHPGFRFWGWLIKGGKIYSWVSKDIDLRALSWNTGLNFLARISGVGAHPLLDMREHLWLTLSKWTCLKFPGRQ